MSKLVILLAILAFISLNTGCERRKEEQVTPSPSPATQTPTAKETGNKEKQILARINGTPIYNEDLKGIDLNDVIMNEILYQEGLRKGIDKTVEDKVEKYKKSLVIRTVLNEYLSTRPDLEEVSNEEIESYYKDHVKGYTYVRIQDITVEDRKIAETIMDRAKNGEDMQKIAAELSVPIKTISMRPKILEKKNLFKSTEVGSVSDIVEDGKRYKILKIIDINSYPLAKFRSAIISNVKSNRTSQALNDYKDKIIKDNDINVEILVKQNGH